jgi:protein TonB
MFERAMLNPAPVRRWAVTVGMAGEVFLVSAALMAPLIWPRILPRAEIVTSILSPPAPVAAFKNPVATPPRPVRRWFNTGLFYRPSAAFQTAAMVNDLPAPEVGVEGGSDGPRSPLAGLLDSVLRPSTPPKPVPAAPPATPVPAAPALIRVSGPVQAALLLRRVEPQYPLAARQARISGTVELSGIIGTDGRIRELHVTSGNPWLAQAALEAVRQWVYQPTLLGGKPVEVLTTIQVNSGCGNLVRAG